MGPDDLLCSRNAWEEKGSLVVLLLAERARSECARSTRAIEDQPAHPLKKKQASLEGALMIVFLKYADPEGPRLGQERVSARSGLGG